MTFRLQETAWWNSCLTFKQLLEAQLGSPQALACTSSAIVRAIWRLRSSRSASVMRVVVSSIFRACACRTVQHSADDSTHEVGEAGDVYMLCLQEPERIAAEHA